VNLGLVELRRGNLDQAKADLEKARDLNPDLPAPHHALGLLADERGLGKDAEVHYAEALRVDPGFAPARANLARRLFARGAFEESREQYLRLTEVAPESLDGWTGLVESYVHLGREGEADETLARARARFGDGPELGLLIARQLLRRGDYREAEALLAPLTHDARRGGAAWAWIAVARIAVKDREGAARAIGEALAVDPKNAVATYAAKELAATPNGSSAPAAATTRKTRR
jgi:tetratricopeptide (TPR) repeat protein